MVMEKILINIYIITFICICILFIWSLINFYLMKKSDVLIDLYNKSHGRINLNKKKLSFVQFIVMLIVVGMFIIEMTMLIFIKFII